MFHTVALWDPIRNRVLQTGRMEKVDEVMFRLDVDGWMVFCLGDMDGRHSR